MKKQGFRTSEIYNKILCLGRPNILPENTSERINYTKRDLQGLHNNNTMPYVDSNDMIKADPINYCGVPNRGRQLDQKQQIIALKGYIKEI